MTEMTAGWKVAKERADQSGSNKFIRLKEKGEKVVVIFVGDPVMSETLWNEAKNQSEPFTEEHKKAGKHPSTKFLQNVYDVATKTIRVLTSNPASFKHAFKACEKYGFMKAFEIERQGIAKDTKTFNTCMPERDLSAEEVAIVKSLVATGVSGELKMHDLNNLDEDDESFDPNSYDKKNGAAAPTNGHAATTPAPTPQAAPAAAPNGTLSAPQYAELRAKLMALPDAAVRVKEFVAKMGVAQIKEIPAAKFDDAMKLLASMAVPPPPPPPAADVDPFA